MVLGTGLLPAMISVRKPAGVSRALAEAGDDEDGTASVRSLALVVERLVNQPASAPA